LAIDGRLRRRRLAPRALLGEEAAALLREALRLRELLRRAPPALHRVARPRALERAGHRLGLLARRRRGRLGRSGLPARRRQALHRLADRVRVLLGLLAQRLELLGRDRLLQRLLHVADLPRVVARELLEIARGGGGLLVGARRLARVCARAPG